MPEVVVQTTGLPNAWHFSFALFDDELLAAASAGELLSPPALTGQINVCWLTRNPEDLLSTTDQPQTFLMFNVAVDRTYYPRFKPR